MRPAVYVAPHPHGVKLPMRGTKAGQFQTSHLPSAYILCVMKLFQRGLHHRMRSSLSIVSSSTA